MSHLGRHAPALVEQIYACVEEPRLWAEFLENLSTVLMGQSSTLGFFDPHKQTASFSVVSGFDAAAQRAYAEYFGAINPWFLKKSHAFCEGSVLPASAAVPDADYRRTEFYHDWGKKNGVFHSLSANLLESGDGIAHINVQRPEKLPEFEEAEFELVRQLVPHLQRAIRLHQRLSILQTGAHAIDHWTCSVFVVNADAVVLQMNRAGEALLAIADGLHISNGRLRAESSRETPGLRTAIAQTVQRSSAPPVVTLTRRRHTTPLAVFVRPAIRTVTLPSYQVALVFVIGAEVSSGPNSAVLETVFGLTPAEVKLATLLVSGATLQQAADRLRLSRNTTKTQLASIFDKTGTRRQSELVSLLMGFNILRSDGI